MAVALENIPSEASVYATGAVSPYVGLDKLGPVWTGRQSKARGTSEAASTDVRTSSFAVSKPKGGLGIPEGGLSVSQCRLWSLQLWSAWVYDRTETTDEGLFRCFASDGRQDFAQVDKCSSVDYDGGPSTPTVLKGICQELAVGR